jgi:flavin-dependent dehydrogenase
MLFNVVIHHDVLLLAKCAGLLTARELASRGISVVVVEEHHEIASEHCGGMVMSRRTN